ncbi:hypothetical protein KIJ96_21425 (plasmid) [Pseudoalteromonas piscicida]|uniref:hypothetical protein n=1 Tax=Pseudoalteromonas piscicida TaxID=43662 RepID=UPI001D0BD560|nr:hypothetical protein [Pseudoalteromonas piscicida]UDM63521.1 hypothetical protein KIJ96_21425 [Pseudoalteromonas piscicida]
MPKLPPMDGYVNHAPHVVLLGAGASIASYLDWGKIGNPLPSMQGLVETLDLKDEIEKRGYKVEELNFEAFYDELSSSGKNPDLCQFIEEKVYNYFSELKLPDKPTIYDYLILSLREKDIIATFNWDPFLIQAYMRSETVTKKRRPHLAFLHGNVSVALCYDCNVVGINGRLCSKCGHPLEPSKLLYPVKHKNYQENQFIKNEWDMLQHVMGNAYFLSVFGYSAPVTDVEAKKLMLEVWSSNEMLEFSEVEVIDILSREELEPKWQDFFFSHHYMTKKDIFSSYLFEHPRRSCDAFASATLGVDPWHENPFPRFETLNELHDWVKPLIAEEEAYQENGVHFSGKPLAPNQPCSNK